MVELGIIVTFGKGFTTILIVWLFPQALLSLPETVKVIFAVGLTVTLLPDNNPGLQV